MAPRGSRAIGTLAARQSVWARAKGFGEDVQGLIRFANAECERGIAPSTALRNLSHATAAFERAVRPLSPAERIRVQDARDVVRRRLWTRTPQQAMPMEHTHVAALWRSDPSDLGLLATLMFAGGLRFSDVVGVRGHDVRMRATHVEVTLRVTKTTSYRCAPQTVAVVLPPPVRLALLRRATRAAQQPLWAVSYRDFVAFLRRIDPSLSAHSARRGFVHAALDAHVDDADVMRVTRHATIEAFAAYAGRLPNRWLTQQLTASAAAMRPLQRLTATYPTPSVPIRTTNPIVV